MDRGAVAGGERTGGVLEFRRPHVVRRRIDQIAREENAVDDPGQVVAVDIAGQFQPDVLLVLLAVAGEAIGAERKGERRQPRIVRSVGEAVGPGREQVCTAPPDGTGRGAGRPGVRGRRGPRSSPPSGEGRIRCRPAFGSNPEASANARARESRRSRCSPQVAAVTKVIGTAVVWPRNRNFGCIVEMPMKWPAEARQARRRRGETR